MKEGREGGMKTEKKNDKVYTGKEKYAGIMYLHIHRHTCIPMYTYRYIILYKYTSIMHIHVGVRLKIYTTYT